MRLTQIIIHFAIAAVIAIVASGCSSGNSKGMKTSDSIMSTADRLEEGRVQIDRVVASLDKLTSAQAGQDLRPLFKDYSKNVDKLESIATDVREQADSMKAQGQAYFKKWDAEQAKINNEDIKTQSAQRRTEVQQAFTRINDKSQSLRDAYRPLMSDLQDIRTALNTDLTQGGVSAIKPIATRVAQAAREVKNAAGAVQEEFKTLGVKMSAKGKA